MRLQEHHKQFVVKRYAQFMRPTDIVEAFICKFAAELPEICDIPYKAWEDFKERCNRFYRIPENDEYPEHLQTDNEEARLIRFGLNDFICRYIKQKLAARFRRLDINHPQFPEKYKNLFTETRETHLNKGNPNSLQHKQNALWEAELLYNLVKKQIFEKNDRTQIRLAHQLLKTIITFHLLEEPGEILDITPENEKQLPNTQKALTDAPESDTDNTGNHAQTDKSL